MSVQNESEWYHLKKVGKLVADTIQLMLENLRPGITTKELDQIGRNFFEKQGARSAPELTYGFPGATCISVNHEVAHGIPGKYKIKKGDMVNIDVSLELDGFFADAGTTSVVQDEMNSLKRHLCNISQNILKETIQAIRSGDKINKIGFTIEHLAKMNGYSVIRNLAGHGTGRNLHEYPDNILNYYEHHDKRKVRSGQVLAIETFISTGSSFVMQAGDGWTLMCPDRSLVAQFEHTIVVTDSIPVILTA